MSHFQPRYQVYPDSHTVAQAAARFWIEQARQAVATHGRFHVALSGGSTPRQLYSMLADEDHAGQIPWQGIELYFGDERVVPRDHPDSNYRMVREALLDHVPLPASQVHPMVRDGNNDEDSARRAAQAYGQTLMALPRSCDGWPVFDLLMLGMGADGHTASLFPGTPILAERSTPVAPVYVEKLAAWRVSLTLPVIRHATALLILVCGEDKADTLQRVLEAGQPSDDLPITHVLGLPNVHLYLDAAAARGLGQP